MTLIVAAYETFVQSKVQDHHGAMLPTRLLVCLLKYLLHVNYISHVTLVVNCRGYKVTTKVVYFQTHQ